MDKCLRQTVWTDTAMVLNLIERLWLNPKIDQVPSDVIEVAWHSETPIDPSRHDIQSLKAHLLAKVEDAQ